MRYLAWFLFLTFVILPLITYLVYYYRRLGTRRKLLLQTILSLNLDDAYMRMRHGQKYEHWRATRPPQERLEHFEESYFNADFRAGFSHRDYLWPVILFMIITGIGWFLTLHRIYPSFTGLAEAKDFLPIAFAYGFVGAFLVSVLTIFDEYRQYNLEPGVYNSVTYRVLFSTTTAYIVGQPFQAEFVPLVAFGVGLFPIERTWAFITEEAAKKVGDKRNEEELGTELAKIQGLEYRRNRQKLVDVNVSTIQALATSDPLWLFFQTTFPLRTIIDLMDKAILYSYLGDKVEELRKHGINGVIELVAIESLAKKIAPFVNQESKEEPVKTSAFFDDTDINKLVSELAAKVDQTPNEFKAFIYNLYYDPLVSFIYEIWGRCLNLDQRLYLENETEMPETSKTANNVTTLVTVPGSLN